MAKSRLFDNIMQVIGVKTALAGTATQSTEVDLELPRGYVAKIHKVKFAIWQILDLGAANEQIELQLALVNDPDDTTTVMVPTNEVEHDVICDFQVDIVNSATALQGLITKFHEQYDFSHLEGMDVLAARNLRFNFYGDTASFDGASIGVRVWYTLEKINDSQIMELLDIL